MKRLGPFQILTVCAAFTCAAVVAQPVTVVEYRNKTLDAHFITGRTNEQQALDVVADFVRTGMSFQASAATTASAGLAKICRFYVSVAKPIVNSHFYGRQGIDCEAILALAPAGFNYEGYDFAVQVPVAGSTPGSLICPAGTLPVYRSFRALSDGKTSNHRYTVSTSTYASAAAAGYVGEGVQFCVPAVTDIADSWTGTAMGTFSSSVITETSTAQVTWILDSVVNQVAVYRPTGNVSATISFVGCSNARLNPSTHALNAATDGTLTIDYNADPPTYHGAGLSSWPAALTCDEGTIPAPYEGEPDFFGGSRGTAGIEAAGTVTTNTSGSTIEGSDSRAISTLGQQTFTWKFTRNK